MFCKNCGHKLEDDAHFCPICGTNVIGEAKNSGADTQSTTQQPPYTPQPPYSQSNQPYPQPVQPPIKANNIIAIVGFVLSFFASIPGLICSIIGYKSADQYEVPNKGLATAGIIISCISICCVLIMMIPLSCILMEMPYIY